MSDDSAIEQDGRGKHGDHPVRAPRKAEFAPATAQAPMQKTTPGRPISKITYPFNRYPEPGKVVGVAEDIWWLSTPLPFRLRAINAFLVEEKEGWTIVDCGYGSEDVRTQWETVWRNQMKDKPVTRVVVTHFHPDHMGNAGWFQEKWGVPPHMSETEWEFANLAANGRHSGDLETRCLFYKKHGLSKEKIDKFRKEMIPYPIGCPTVPDSYSLLREGDLMTINGKKWTVMIGYGHSPEHVCLYSDELGVMIAGDQILPDITPNVSAWHFEPDANPLEGFIKTMKRFRAALRRDTLVLPAHRRPFVGVHERFDELEHHHHNRLGEIMAAIGPAGITSGDLIPLIFPGDLDGHEISFGMHEALAHLNFLMYESKLARKTDADSVVRYFKA